MGIGILRTGLALILGGVVSFATVDAQEILERLVVTDVDHRATQIGSSSSFPEIGDVFDQVGYNSMCTEGNCDSCSICDSDCCDGACSPATCPPPWWAHRTGVFGEFLLLHPGDTDIVYATEQNDIQNNAFPTGPTGTAAIDMSPGFRVGFSLANTYTTSLVASYTHWEGNTRDQITRLNGNILNSQIIHPSTLTTGGNSLQSSASTSMSFDQIDAVYRHKLFCTDTTIFNWSGGFRFGHLEQGLVAQQDVSVATGLVTVNSDIDFDGFGFLMGLDAERRSCNTGMLCYTKGLASFLGGEWSGSYRQTNQISQGVVANRYSDFRVTPVLEAGLGVGWQSDSGCIRATVGYTATCWYNALTTRSYVNGVRTGNYVNLDESISFIGLTSQLEFRF